MRATVEESSALHEELVPVPAGRDLALLEHDLARLEKEPIPGIVATRGVDREARAYRRAAARGELLGEWARGRTREEIVRVADTVLEALGRLHERGLVLGGIGPQGVRVEDGKPVLVDLARISEEPARLGPRASTAPEALAGARTDRRTDIHGLGALLAPLLPGEDLRALVAKDPHERAGTAAAARATLAGKPREQTPSPSRAWHSPLVGRTSRLEEVLEAARSALLVPPAPDAPGIVLVHGAPGLGRTRFLDEVLVRLAGEGVDVVRATGTSVGTAPLGIFSELLRALAPTDETAARALTERARTTFARLSLSLPGVGLPALPEPPAPESADEAHEARLAFADTIASTLLELGAGRPLVLAIDDIDRCDAGSRFVARHLARRLAVARKWLRGGGRSGSNEGEAARPCVIFATTSTLTVEEKEPPADETGAYSLDVGALAREAFALDVRLEALDEDALATIAASLTGDVPSSPRVRELARAAHGNAGLVTESVRAGSILDSLEGALRGRVDAVEPRGRTLLLALVALGHEADAALVARVAGLELDGTVRAALAGLVTEGLARRSPGGYSLRPILHDVLAREKEQCAERLGAALAESLDADPVAAAEWAAAHGEVELLERAAPRALRALSALHADRRAATLALAWADVLLARNEPGLAVERLLEAATGFQRAGNLAAAQEALLRATTPALQGTERPGAGTEATTPTTGTERSGLPAAPGDASRPGAELRARCWRKLGVVRASLGLTDASHAAFRRARAALARASGPAAGIERARVLLAETEVSLAQGELDIAAERGEAGLKTLREAAQERAAVDSGASPPGPREGLRPSDSPQSVEGTVAQVRSRLLALLGQVALLRDRPKEAETLLLAALAIDERNGNDAGAARIHQRLGGVALARGDLETALKHWRASLGIRERIGDRSGVAHVHANLSLAEARRGDLARAEALLRRSLRIREEMGDRRGRAASLHNLGYIEACRGDLAAAVSALEECLALRDELGDRWYAASARNNLGQVLLDLGRLPAAGTLLEEALETRRALGDRSGEAASLANLADLALRRGDFALAIEREALARRMREGVASAEDSIDQLRRGARLELALGNVEVALEAAQGAVRLARQNGLPLQEGPSRLLHGEALARSGKLDKSKRELERARSTADKTGDRLTARRAEVELAALLAARGFPEDARALLDSKPVPFTRGREEDPPLEAEGPLLVREQLLRARIELNRAGGLASLAHRMAVEAAATARKGEERELEWRALRIAQAAAEKAGQEEPGALADPLDVALQLGAAAQEIVESLLANVPEPRRELYLGADPARAAALRGDPALAALLARPEATQRMRIELRGAGLEDDAPTRPARSPRAATRAPRPATKGVTLDPSAVDLVAIASLNRRILDERDGGRVFTVLVEAAARLCGAERALLVLFPDGEHPELVAARGFAGEGEAEPRKFDEKALPGERVALAAARRTALSGEPVVIADARAPRSSEDRAAPGTSPRSVVAATVRAGERRGALYLDHRFQMGIFGARELRLAEAIADQCALALVRLALEERLRARDEGSSEAAARPAPKPVVEPARFHGLVGRSPSLRKTIARIAELASGERPVLVTGPGGVGKELAARALHAAGRRSKGPFVVLDLRDAASPEDLEKALRGPEPLEGGALGAARGGTLLLRSLDAAPAAVALVLARAVDEALARRERTSPRLVATAGGPLRPELDAIFPPRDRVELASLSARREDVPALVGDILARLAGERGAAKTISASALAQLARRSFPGEARELVACLAAAWARAGKRAEIQPADLPGGRSTRRR